MGVPLVYLKFSEFAVFIQAADRALGVSDTELTKISFCKNLISSRLSLGCLHMAATRSRRSLAAVT